MGFVIRRRREEVTEGGSGGQLSSKLAADYISQGISLVVCTIRCFPFQPLSASLEKEPSTETGVWTTMTSLTKQRMRLNMKILGQFGSQSGNSVTSPQIKEDKPTYREQFVPPEMSMVSYFLNKVSCLVTEGHYRDTKSIRSL